MENIPGYKIKRKLGSGGMADVYLATQESFGRDVAIKILLSSIAGEEEFAARFIREAKIVAGLSHPHIIPVYDVGKFNQYYYMSMDYLPGGDLTQWIKAGIPEEEILKIVRQMADALQYAHQKGYMHRDIKPANIMFREDNSAVLTDFGIARLQDAGDQLTQAGTIIGTPTYMSPEAIKGKKPDGRTDIYALGIVFYEMLMKEVPYRASEFTAVAYKHVQEPIPVLPRAYTRYQEFLDKIVAKNPDDRFQSGREIVRAIDKLQQEKVLTPVSADGIKVQESQTQRSSSVGSSGKVHSLFEMLAGIEKGATFTEKSQRKGGVFKTYTLCCNFNIEDAFTLPVIFTQASDRIIDWHKERGGHVEDIEFNFLIEKWGFDGVDESISKLYDAGGVYEFLKKIPIKVNMVSHDGISGQGYIINKKGEKVYSS
ncbi:MAG: serine/threonine protein kinase [Gammaproteobacteria bacterium]|nr:serine/threonine protein kinase [Gammaproteobacteria bacterium]